MIKTLFTYNNYNKSFKNSRENKKLRDVKNGSK